MAYSNADANESPNNSPATERPLIITTLILMLSLAPFVVLYSVIARAIADSL